MKYELGQLSERLKEALKGRSVRSIAESADVSEGTLRNMLNGGIPKLDSLISIANACQVRFEWLAVGVGTMETAETEDSTPQPEPDYMINGRVFDEVVAAVRSDDSEMRAADLDWVLGDIVRIYNSVINLPKQHQQMAVRLRIVQKSQAMLQNDLRRLKRSVNAGSYTEESIKPMLTDIQANLAKLEKEELALKAKLEKARIFISHSHVS